MIRVTAILSVAMLASSALLAQTPDASPEYVATVKPSNPAVFKSSIQLAPGGRFMATGATVGMLIKFTEDLMDDQLLGGPSWIGSERYDIVGQLDNPLGADPRTLNDEQRMAFQQQVKKMVEAVLADRFQLKFHREMKELPVFALVVDKNGAKLSASQQDARPSIRRTALGEIAAQHASSGLLAEFLSAQVGRSVIDKTGLTGSYDFKLAWTPDPSQLPASMAAGGEGAPNVPEGPSIFTALKEQLGLRLEPQKGPVAILMIDRIEKPSVN